MLGDVIDYWDDGRPGADLADAVLTMARELEADGLFRDPGIEPLTTGEIRVLRWVHLHGPSAPSAIATGTRMQRSNLSTTLRRLEALGFVRREHVDGTRVLVHHTARADDRLDRVRADLEDRLSSVLAGIPAADLATTTQVLRDVLAAMERDTAA